MGCPDTAKATSNQRFAENEASWPLEKVQQNPKISAVWLSVKITRCGHLCLCVGHFYSPNTLLWGFSLRKKGWPRYASPHPRSLSAMCPLYVLLASPLSAVWAWLQIGCVSALCPVCVRRLSPLCPCPPCDRFLSAQVRHVSSPLDFVCSWPAVGQSRGIMK